MKIISALLLSLVSLAASAQTSQASSSGFSTDAFHTGANEYQVWGGYSPDSLSGIGKSEARHLFMAGAGWRRVLLATDNVAWKFTLDIVPVALISQPTLNGTEVVLDPKRFGNLCSTQNCSRRTTYGIGSAPIGFQFNFRRRHRVQPILGANAGILRFSREVPIPNSASINFTFGFAGGVQIFTKPNQSVTLGYVYHHISNANSGTPFNPGIDSNFIYAGYSIHR